MERVDVVREMFNDQICALLLGCGQRELMAYFVSKTKSCPVKSETETKQAITDCLFDGFAGDAITLLYEELSTQWRSDGLLTEPDEFFELSRHAQRWADVADAYINALDTERTHHVA